MNKEKLNMIVDTLAAWNPKDSITHKNGILKIKLEENPYHVEVQSGGVILYKTEWNYDAHKEISKPIAVLTAHNDFNSYGFLNSKELEIMAEISSALRTAKS